MRIPEPDYKTLLKALVDDIDFLADCADGVNGLMIESTFHSWESAINSHILSWILAREALEES